MLLTFCDASVLNNSMGLGVVVCKASHQGERIKVDEIIYIYKKIINNIGNHEKHHYEFYSILEGLAVLRTMPKEESIVFNDCSNSIELLERLSSQKKSKKFKDRDFFIKSMGATGFDHIHFQWLPRSNKGIYIADKLSKTFHSYMGEKVTLKDFLKMEEDLKLTYFYRESFSQSLMHNNIINKWTK